MKTITLIIAGLALTAAVLKAQSTEVPELVVLNHYVGDWDTIFTVQSGSDPSKQQEMRATVSAEWILGGRFVRQTSEILGDGAAGTFILETVMTWDAKAEVFRSWSFTSSGTSSEARGTWDAKAREMVWVGVDRDSGNVTKITASFRTKGEEHWSIATESPSGSGRGLITGVNTRTKRK